MGVAQARLWKSSFFLAIVEAGASAEKESVKQVVVKDEASLENW